VAGANLRSVVRDLNEAGYGTAFGKQWSAVAVWDMLCRPHNAGLTRYGDETPGELAADCPGGHLACGRGDPEQPRAADQHR
jgi:hypothetical protein